MRSLFGRVFSISWDLVSSNVFRKVWKHGLSVLKMSLPPLWSKAWLMRSLIFSLLPVFNFEILWYSSESHWGNWPLSNSLMNLLFLLRFNFAPSSISNLSGSTHSSTVLVSSSHPSSSALPSSVSSVFSSVFFMTRPVAQVLGASFPPFCWVVWLALLELAGLFKTDFMTDLGFGVGLAAALDEAGLFNTFATSFAFAAGFFCGVSCPGDRCTSALLGLFGWPSATFSGVGAASDMATSSTGSRDGDK